MATHDARIGTWLRRRLMVVAVVGGGDGGAFAALVQPPDSRLDSGDKLLNGD